jgi:hypothetical protein
MVAFVVVQEDAGICNANASMKVQTKLHTPTVYMKIFILVCYKVFIIKNFCVYLYII